MRACILLLLSCLLANAANLIHNSSFEVGASGWFVWGNTNRNDAYGNEAAVASLVVNTNGSATHGSHSMAFQTRLIARGFLMPAGPCALTFDARGFNAGILSAGVQQTYKAKIDAELIPTNNFSITTSWQRFTNVFIAPTSGWYMVKFVAGRTWIDRVQVETGSVASAYAPMPLEVGMDTADSENALFLGDAKTLRFNFWNALMPTNVSVYYQLVSSIWNTNIASGLISTNALATNANVTINLTLPTINGAIRALCYITNIYDTWDETSIAVFPFAAQNGRNTNGLLGLDTHFNPYHLQSIRQIGFSWIRVFSLTKYLRWVQIFPTLTTTNIYDNKWFSDYVIERIATNDLVPLVVLSGEDNAWYPETNASLAVMVADFTNYVGRIVYRYSQAPYNVHHWEIFNEPHQSGRVNPNVSDSAVYANIYTNSARLVKVIDPASTVVGFGGYSQGSLGDSAWSAFTPQGKTDADVLSWHLYPQMAGNSDPNWRDDYRDFSTANLDPIMQSFGGVRPLWMTESFITDAGGYHGVNQTFEYPFFWGVAPGWTSEAEFNTQDNMAMPAMDRITYSFVRAVGWGFAQYNFQSGRMTDDTIFQTAHPTIYEINNTFKPWCVALAMANHFVKTPGLGRVTNANAYYVEAYIHTNSLGVVVPIWCQDRTNRTLTCSSSPGALYDTMGNLISTNSLTVPLTRSIRYLVSGTLSYAQMTNLIMSASVATNLDVIAPGLTVDLSPVGETIAWGVTGTNAFKATALDESVVQYGGGPTQNPPPVIPSNQTNVQYRWSFNAGTTWSPWGATNHFYKSFDGPGQYAVTWQAKDSANNTSTVTGPTFGDLTPGATNVLNVSGQMNLGTITVVQ